MTRLIWLKVIENPLNRIALTKLNTQSMFLGTPGGKKKKSPRKK